MPKDLLPSSLALAACQQNSNTFVYKEGYWTLPTLELNWLSWPEIAQFINRDGRTDCGFCDANGNACSWKPKNNRTPTHVDLGRHELTHCEGGYQCAICPKFFKQKSQLDTHVRTHTRQKPFKCTCGTVEYSDLSSMTRHQNDMKRQNDQREHHYYDGRFTTIEQARAHKRDPLYRKARKNCARQNPAAQVQGLARTGAGFPARNMTNQLGSHLFSTDEGRDPPYRKARGNCAGQNPAAQMVAPAQMQGLTGTGTGFPAQDMTDPAAQMIAPVQMQGLAGTGTGFGAQNMTNQLDFPIDEGRDAERRHWPIDPNLETAFDPNLEPAFEANLRANLESFMAHPNLPTN